MTDRQPGAPGQYTMTIDASVAQNILIGQPVTVKLVRDDQPLVEGTPYNKASVLPDDLAERICPNVVDPTPADAFEGLLSGHQTIDLSNYGWSETAPYTQRVAARVSKNDYPHVGLVPDENVNVALAQEEAWGCVSRGITQDGSITFLCYEEKPEVNLTVQIEVNR